MKYENAFFHAADGRNHPLWAIGAKHKSDVDSVSPRWYRDKGKKWHLALGRVCHAFALQITRGK